MSKKVLILDDDPVLSSYLSSLVSRLGFETTVCHDSILFFELVKQNEYELILLDVHLKETSGVRVLNTIKNQSDFRFTPVIMITADENVTTLSECFEEGADDYITKPVNPIVLEKRLTKALKQRDYMLFIERENNKLQEQKKELANDNFKVSNRLEMANLNIQELSETTSHLASATWRERKQKDELNTALEELEKSKKDIENKNKKIVASIHYAKRIQHAILPPVENIQEFIKDTFVFFSPRDVISGDFYWFQKLNEDEALLAAIDCTGHGVPGAFMSMIGNSLLNGIVFQENIHEVDEVLTALNKGVRKALNQNETQNRDGMDMALVKINRKTKTVEYAGAKNPLLYIKDGEAITVKGDIHPIGGKTAGKRIYTKHVLKLDKGTMFYLFSDGMQDQFGGEKNRKYMIKKLRQDFVAIHKLSIQDQYDQIDIKLGSWMNHDGKFYSQMDDVLVIGFRL